MKLREALEKQIIQVGDILCIVREPTDKDADGTNVVVEVLSVGSGIKTKDLKLNKGYCGNKNGERGFYNESLNEFEFIRYNVKENPEYFL